MTDRTLTGARMHRARLALGRLRPPAGARRPALYLTVAAAGAVLVSVFGAGEPPAQADTATESVSIARQLGLSDAAAPINEDSVRSLEQLAASRSEREAERSAAVQAQAAADKKELEARAAAERPRREAAEQARREQAAAEARARAEAQAAAAATAEEAAAPAPAAAPAGSFQDYARGKLGGDADQFSCLESLWGKESGWNPTAQNVSSTAYGIPQFLDSTWASTGIAKTSDGYRQIDAGLIYIGDRYGSPCGAWAHSQANGWY